LSKINLRRGHLLGEAEWTPTAERFTCNWIKRLSDWYSTTSDSLLKNSVKKLMEAYRTLMKNVKCEGEKLAVFLLMPFHTVDKQPTLHLSFSCISSIQIRRGDR